MTTAQRLGSLKGKQTSSQRSWPLRQPSLTPWFGGDALDGQCVYLLIEVLFSCRDTIVIR